MCTKHRYLTWEAAEADIRRRKLKFDVVPYVCRECTAAAGEGVWHETKDKRTVRAWRKMRGLEGENG